MFRKHTLTAVAVLLAAARMAHGQQDTFFPLGPAYPSFISDVRSLGSTWTWEFR
jgi:hypothetical protein